jgi:7,8-dihydropterin-6-yl-methyl-4-(beta-D-ribofuranosyl)aminobenzene 5'-phosphate synthase
MKITTLIENLVYKPGFHAEHGLAFLIETADKKILFDTGQSPAFMSNTEKLNIDISDIDAVVISHGHYDHTGGLNAFLQKNTKAKVYAKPDIFNEKYHGTQRFIGTVCDHEIVKNRIIFIENTIEIDDGIFIIPEIPIVDATDTSFKNFKIHQNNGFEKDEFNDELFLAIILDNKLSVISSCSHRGISNITRAALSRFKLPINLILGGFHLKDTSPEQYTSVTSYFRDIKPENLGICHCTGVDKYADLKRDCDCNVFYSYTGSYIML